VSLHDESEVIASETDNAGSGTNSRRPARTDGALTIVVESAGSVEPHVRSNLFRRFVTTREDKGGTGLGLAIVRAVAEAHGGQVTLNEAGPPKVRFALRLPRPQGPSLLV
jgi:signal transduction histidine kinase